MDSMFYEFIDKYNGNYELYYICKYIYYIYGITYEKLIEEYMPLICYNTKIHKYSELNKNSIAYKDKIGLLVKCENNFKMYYTLIFVILIYKQIYICNEEKIWIPKRQRTLSNIRTFKYEIFDEFEIIYDQIFKYNLSLIKKDSDNYLITNLQILFEIYNFSDRFYFNIHNIYSINDYEWEDYYYNFYNYLDFHRYFIHYFQYIFHIFMNILELNLFIDHYNSILELFYNFNFFNIKLGNLNKYRFLYLTAEINIYSLIAQNKILLDFTIPTDTDEDVLLKYDRKLEQIVNYYRQYLRYCFVSSIIRYINRYK